MLKIRYSSRFKKDYKKMIKRGCNPEYLVEILRLLCNQLPLPEKQ